MDRFCRPRPSLTPPPTDLHLLSQAERLQLPIADLDLAPPVFDALDRAGIQKVSDLLQLTPKKLKEIRNIGPTRARQVFQALARIGFHRQNQSARASS